MLEPGPQGRLQGGQRGWGCVWGWDAAGSRMLWSAGEVGCSVVPSTAQHKELEEAGFGLPSSVQARDPQLLLET